MSVEPADVLDTPPPIVPWPMLVLASVVGGVLALIDTHAAVSLLVVVRPRLAAGHWLIDLTAAVLAGAAIVLAIGAWQAFPRRDESPARVRHGLLGLFRGVGYAALPAIVAVTDHVVHVAGGGVGFRASSLQLDTRLLVVALAPVFVLVCIVPVLLIRGRALRQSAADAVRAGLGRRQLALVATVGASVLGAYWWLAIPHVPRVPADAAHLDRWLVCFDDPRTRNDAFDPLLRIGAPAVAPLEERWSNIGFGVGDDALVHFVRQASWTVPLVRHLTLSDPNLDREAVASVLALMTYVSEATPVLRRLTRTGSWTAAAGLSARGRVGVEILIELLPRRSGAAGIELWRASVGHQRGYILDRVRLLACEGAVDDRDAALQWLALVAPDEGRTLAEIIREGPREVRVAALRCLLWSNRPATDAAYAAALDDPDPEIRIAALEGRKEAPWVPGPTGPWLAERWQRESDPRVRAAVLRLCQRHGVVDPFIDTMIRDALADGSPELLTAVGQLRASASSR